MTETLWCVIMSGYTKQHDGLGYDEPELICACDRKDVADAILANLQRIGDCLNEIQGTWIPDKPTTDKQHFIAPALSFIIPVDNNLKDNWQAIVTEQKTFSLEHDENIFTIGNTQYNTNPSDFTPCKNLRFHTATQKQINTILQVHKCGTPHSDGKVVYFLRTSNTFVQQ